MAFYIILLLLRARVCYFICMCYFCSYEMVIMKNLFRTVSVIALAGWFLACSERKSEACYEIILPRWKPGRIFQAGNSCWMMACVLFTRERTRQCATTLCFWRIT